MIKPKHWLRDFLGLFYPQICITCSEALIGREVFFCADCLQNLPKTNYHLQADNAAYNQLAGKVPVQKAAAWLYYNKGGKAQQTIAEIKYRGNIAFGKWIGRSLAQDIQASGFFDEINCLIPIPLHPKKRWQRGFNQTEILAQGISEIIGIPIDCSHLYRGKANETQTKKSLYERWRNTQNLFQVRNPDDLKNQHILLIDDVLTTGSTLEACIRALLQCTGIRVSVLTVAIA
ncbi:MAG: ComF family protein [Candidatus Symbiothrix sp.]|jgi:ComF family protein|nr:ComF family protein [Candidatus Symbiothrix sp.]